MRKTTFLIVFFICTLCSCSKKNDLENKIIDAYTSYSKMDMKQAEKICNEIIINDKNNFQALFLKSKIMFYSNRKPEALKLLDKITKKFPWFVDAKLFQIKALIETDRLLEAEKNLKKIIKENGNDFRVYALYSQLALKNNDLKLQLGYEKKAEECLDESVMIFLNLSAIYNNAGIKDISKEYLDKAEIIVHDLNIKKQIHKMKEKIQ